MKKPTSFIKQLLFPGVGLFLVFALMSCGAKESSSTTTEPAAAEQSASADCLAGK